MGRRLVCVESTSLCCICAVSVLKSYRILLHPADVVALHRCDLPCALSCTVVRRPATLQWGQLALRMTETRSVADTDPVGFKEDALVLVAEAAAALIADDADGGDSGIKVGCGTFEDAVARAGQVGWGQVGHER